MARPTFENLRDETMERMGKLDPSTALQGRFEQVMTSAYYTLALTYHHYELHTVLLTVLTSGSPELVIPDEAYVVQSVGLAKEQTMDPFFGITHEHLYAVVPINETGDPSSYTRTSNAAGDDVLLFSKIPERDIPVELRFYRRPAEPDYTAAATSELDDLWDEYIIQKTLQLFWPAGFRFDFAGVAQQTLAEFLQLQIQPPLVQPVRDVPERTLTSEAVGGQQ